MRPKSHERCKYHFFWCRNAAGFGVRYGRDLAADSSGLEMKHGITKQNYCRGLGSQTVTAETRNWTEHKMYVLRYIRTWRGKKRVLLGHPGLPTDISVHTFAIHLPFQFIHLPFCSMILWNMHEANGITMVNINLFFLRCFPWQWKFMSVTQISSHCLLEYSENTGLTFQGTTISRQWALLVGDSLAGRIRVAHQDRLFYLQ